LDEADRDRLRRRVFWSMPAGLYLIGSRDGDRLNFMTASWVVQLATEPKLLGVGVETSALTLELIRAGGAFTVGTIAREDRAMIRKFVKPVKPEDVEAGSTVHGFPYGLSESGAPLLEDAVGWFDCQFDQEMELGSHSLVVGRVLAAGFNRPEDTPLLRMEDTRMNYGG
jgi:flavin reductase (DIM6/NTAB) family NADH-FMN oxidoreductase RutF